MGLSDWFERHFDTSDENSMPYAFNLLLKELDLDIECLREMMTPQFAAERAQRNANQKIVADRNDLRERYNDQITNNTVLHNRLLEQQRCLYRTLTGQDVGINYLVEPIPMPYISMKFGDLMEKDAEEQDTDAYRSQCACEIARLGMFERKLNELDRQWEKELQLLQTLEQLQSSISNQQRQKLAELLATALATPRYDARGTMTLEYQHCIKRVEDLVTSL